MREGTIIVKLSGLIEIFQGFIDKHGDRDIIISDLDEVFKDLSELRPDKYFGFTSNYVNGDRIAKNYTHGDKIALNYLVYALVKEKQDDSAK